MFDNDLVSTRRKLLGVSSALRMMQRTMDSPDCSVYLQEMSSTLEMCIEHTAECDRLLEHRISLESDQLLEKQPVI